MIRYMAGFVCCSVRSKVMASSKSQALKQELVAAIDSMCDDADAQDSEDDTQDWLLMLIVVDYVMLPTSHMPRL